MKRSDRPTTNSPRFGDPGVVCRHTYSLFRYSYSHTTPGSSPELLLLWLWFWWWLLSISLSLVGIVPNRTSRSCAFVPRPPSVVTMTVTVTVTVDATVLLLAVSLRSFRQLWMDHPFFVSCLLWPWVAVDSATTRVVRLAADLFFSHLLTFLSRARKRDRERHTHTHEYTYTYTTVGCEGIVYSASNACSVCVPYGTVNVMDKYRRRV